LLSEDYPEAEKVIFLCDNLNTDKIASLYEAFEPKQALTVPRIVGAFAKLGLQCLLACQHTTGSIKNRLPQILGQLPAASVLLRCREVVKIR
jgi:hypothetical protein